MKKTLFAAIIMAMTMTAAFAAVPKDTARRHIDPEKLAEMRCKAMARQLMLDDKTAAKFAPIYKAYLKDMGEIRVPAREQRDKLKELEGDARIKASVEAGLERYIQLGQIRKKYFTKFCDIMSAQQAARVIKEQTARPVMYKKVSAKGPRHNMHRSHMRRHWRAFARHRHHPVMHKPMPCGDKPMCPASKGKPGGKKAPKAPKK